MPVGERVVAYFDHIGGIEGVVVRVFDGGFAFSIAATKHKREKLAAQLTWLANRSELGARTAAATSASRRRTASRRCSWPKASC